MLENVLEINKKSAKFYWYFHVWFIYYKLFGSELWQFVDQVSSMAPGPLVLKYFLSNLDKIWYEAYIGEGNLIIIKNVINLTNALKHFQFKLNFTSSAQSLSKSGPWTWKQKTFILFQHLHICWTLKNKGLYYISSRVLF